MTGQTERPPVVGADEEVLPNRVAGWFVWIVAGGALNSPVIELHRRIRAAARTGEQAGNQLPVVHRLDSHRMVSGHVSARHCGCTR